MGYIDKLSRFIGLSEDTSFDDITEEEIEKEKQRLATQQHKKDAISNKSSSPIPYPAESSFSTTPRTTTSGESHTVVAPERKSLVKQYSAPLQLVLMAPSNFEDSPVLVDKLQNGKPVIINLDYSDKETAEKTFNFLSGATYALSGNAWRIANNIFLFTPTNVDVIADSIMED